MKQQSMSIIIFPKNSLYPFKKLLLLGITQPPQLHGKRATSPGLTILNGNLLVYESFYNNTIIF